MFAQRTGRRAGATKLPMNESSESQSEGLERRARGRRRSSDDRPGAVPLTVVDALGRTLVVEARPQRIVSLVPSLTEALFAFGLDGEIAGITRFCTEPRDGVADKTKVGGTKSLDIGKIAKLGPDLVIASAEENNVADVSSLIDSGLPVFVTLPTSVEGAIEILRQLAAMTESTPAAQPIITEAKEALASARAANARREPLRVFCPVWRKPYMTVGRGTYINDVIACCGGRNIFGEEIDRYPQVELKQVAALDPEVILLPSEPYRFEKKHKSELRAFPEVTAVRNDSIFLVDGKMLCWYGPRIGRSLRELNGLLDSVRGRRRTPKGETP